MDLSKRERVVLAMGPRYILRVVESRCDSRDVSLGLMDFDAAKEAAMARHAQGAMRVDVFKVDRDSSQEVRVWSTDEEGG